MQIWLNDGLVTAASAGVALDGWPDGEGIFETIKTENGEVSGQKLVEKEIYLFYKE